MSAKEWGTNFLNENSKKWRIETDENAGHQTWYLGNYWLFHLNSEEKTFTVSYSLFVSILSDRFHLNYDDIETLIRGLVLKRFNCEEFTPQWFVGPFFRSGIKTFNK